MSSSIKTILIFGGTGGIGESFARRFHRMGKTVIITGRREKRLAELQKELPGLQTRVIDNADIAALPEKVAEITKSFPELDTVWINSGIQKRWSFLDSKSSSDEMITEEITINVTAPMILTRLFMPHLLAHKSEANIMITSSGLAFVPMGVYPIYCPTKAAIHHFMVGLRQQLNDTNVNVIEIAPPYVATELDANHRGSTSNPPMALAEYTDKTFEILDSNKASELKEVAVGFAANGAGAWRGSIGRILEALKIGG